MRWLWIDRFVEFKSGQSARAVKNLSLAEDLFRDHFPDYPVMPAALMLEGIAQTGGILVGEVNDFKEKVVLAKVVYANFRREALAGETLIYDVTMLHLRPEGASVEGKIHALPAGSPIPGAWTEPPLGEAELFFAHLDKARSAALFGDRNCSAANSSTCWPREGPGHARRRLRGWATAGAICPRCCHGSRPTCRAHRPRVAHPDRPRRRPLLGESLPGEVGYKVFATSTPALLPRSPAKSTASIPNRAASRRRNARARDGRGRSSSSSPPPRAAMIDAKVEKEKFDPTRFGVSFGRRSFTLGTAGSPQSPAVTRSGSGRGRRPRAATPCRSDSAASMLKYLLNMLATHVSILHNAQGPSNSITEECGAGLHHSARRHALGCTRRLLPIGGADAKINPPVRPGNRSSTSRQRFQLLREGVLTVRRETPGVVDGEGGQRCRCRRARACPNNHVGEYPCRGPGFGRSPLISRDGGGTPAIRVAWRRTCMSSNSIATNAHVLVIRSSTCGKPRASARRAVCAGTSVKATAWATLEPAATWPSWAWPASRRSSTARFPVPQRARSTTRRGPGVDVRLGWWKSPYFMVVGWHELGLCAAVVQDVVQNDRRQRRVRWSR